MGAESRRRNGQRGISYIELLVALAVLAVLATAIVPVYRWDEKRRREAHLREHLHTMRTAIDQYKKYSDEGLIILHDVDQLGYPETLDEMVEGVDVGDPQSTEAKVVRFLQRIPVDPFTGETEWGMRSYQDDWDANSWGGENVYDVYSLSEVRALDGTYYKDW